MKQAAAAIEFGTSKIVVLVGEKSVGGRCDILAEATVPYAGFDRDGEWIDPKNLEQSIAKAIKEAEEQFGKRIKRIYVGVPGDMTGVECKDARISFGKIRKVAYSDIETLFRSSDKYDKIAEYYKVIHRSPVYFRLDDGRKIMEPLGFASAGIQGRVSYVFGSVKFMDDIEYILREQGIAVNDYISVPMAEVLTLLPLQDRDKIAILADVGALSTFVTVARGDGIIYHDFFHTGGEHITKDLMEAFNEKFMNIEGLKKQVVFGYNMGDQEFYEITNSRFGGTVKLPYNAVQDIVEKRVDEIAQKIIGILNTKECVIPSGIPIYLTGGGLSHMRGCKEHLTYKLKRQVNLASPKTPRLNKPQYSGAVGVLEMALEDVTQKDHRMLSSVLNFFKN